MPAAPSITIVLYLYTPHAFAGGVFHAPKAMRRMRLSLAARWSIWFVPAAIRTTSPANLSPPRSDPQLGRRCRHQASCSGGEEFVAAESEELVRLRREVRQLRQERDILSNAAAWFARETGTLPSRSWGS